MQALESIALEMQALSFPACLISPFFFFFLIGFVTSTVLQTFVKKQAYFSLTDCIP